MRRSMPLVLLVAVLALHGTAGADMFPQYRVDAMCDQADVILEGTCVGKNIVKIDKVHAGAPLLGKDAGAVEVAQLDRHSKSLFLGGKIIAATKLVLFLRHGKEANQWEAISTIDDAGQCGSCGVFWFDDATCYGYMQEKNPGPYGLFAARDPRLRIPRTIEDMRADIETGLANSREWRRTLTIGDPTEKAQALSRYLLKSTSPKGDKGTYRHAVREPLAALGKGAVPTLIQILRNAPPDENLDEIVLILYDIGTPAAPAVPDLHALLTQPKRVFTGYVLSALGSTGDVRAIPDLQAYLENDDERLAHDAKEALDTLRTRQAQMSRENEKTSAESKNALNRK